MPTRWLSIRKRHPFLHQDFDSQPTARQQDFDFAFGESPSTIRSAPGRTGPQPVEIRPTTSGDATGRRKLRVEAPSIRPRTSENHKPSPLHITNAVSKSEDSLIGLAFGSPSHPPTSFCTPPEDHSPTDHSPFPRHFSPGRDKSAQMQSKRWRKFGTLFKSRQAAIRRDEVPSGPTIGLPTGLVVLDKSPTGQTNKLEEHKLRPILPEHPKHGPPPPPIEKDARPSLKGADLPIQRPEDDTTSRPSTTTTDAGPLGESHGRPPIPKLELDIPHPPLDRYSVMFRNVPANRSSSLLARRSKTLDSLKSLEDSRPTTKGEEDDDPKTASEPLTPLKPPRRLTTPTTTRSPAISKYSLFPTTSPAPVKIVGRVPSAENDNQAPSPLRRSATSPARLSPMQDHFSSVAKPEPLNPKRTVSNEQMVHSPDDNTASTDREAPWSSAHSLKSSVSSATTVDEIFFDIKSFRDSKGIEDGHFVMTRPDSAQVELVRTRSKRVGATSRLRRVEASRTDEAVDQPATLPPPPTTITAATSTATTKHTSVNTAYFDEAIAAVERLTSPTSTTDAAVEKVPPIAITIPTVTIANHDDKPQQSVVNVAGSPARPHDHHFSRLNNMSRGEVIRLIPSPVAEVKEDISPKSDSTPSKSLTPQPAQQTQMTKVLSPRITAVKRIDRPIDDSPTIPQGPPSPKRAPKVLTPINEKPPPVPKKDAKFIPLSKYAAKNTVTAIERVGITPTRPVRANTDDVATRKTPVRAAKERSATLPSSLQPQPQESTQNSSLRGLEKTVPPRSSPVALNPITTEVAVARTVSLSRKQSARVLVPGPKLAARRAEAEAKAESQSQTSSPQSQPPPSASTSQPQHQRQPSKSILGHRHRRSTSKSLSKDKIKITKPQSEKTGKFWSKDSERQIIKEARKWEILEKKSYSPVVVQAERAHKPGLSVGLVVESI